MDSKKPLNKFKKSLAVFGSIVFIVLVFCTVINFSKINLSASKDYSITQLTSIAGEPIKWVKTIHNKDVALKVPIIASNVKVSTSTQGTSTTLDITNADRKKLSKLASERDNATSTLALLDLIKKSKAQENNQGFVATVLDSFSKIGSSLTASVGTADTADKADEMKPVDIKNESTSSVSIEYETPAPIISEAEKENGKIVVVSATDTPEAIITNVLAYANIPEIYKVGQEDKIKIKWVNNDQNIFFRTYDLDRDGYLDYVEWNVPHLSTQAFEIIYITNAVQLDENKNAIKNIYDEVHLKDGVWSDIKDGQFIRVTFQHVLDNHNDNTIYARPTHKNGKGKIEIYPVYSDQNGNLIGDTIPVAVIENIDHVATYKTLLSKLEKPTNIFDLKISGNIDIDYIVDPVCVIASDDALYTVCTYTSSDTFFTPGGVTTASVLVIGGGGGGGGQQAGGGGGGGYIASTSYPISGSITVTVGAGGTAGAGSPSGGQGGRGATSTFGTINAIGGGGGGGNGQGGGTGGSGGGDGINSNSAGAGTAGQGNNGGASGGANGGSGGGGAGAVGANGSSPNAGNGGNGTANSISGSSVTYAGGGGGGTCCGGTAGTGGTGGGGNGSNSAGTGSNGTANTGGGGGGGSQTDVWTGGIGGSGIVIVRYLTNVGSTRTWSGLGADNNWSTPGNWVGGVAPVAGDNLIFTGSTRLSPNNDFTAGTGWGTITISASGFTLGGNSIGTAAISVTTFTSGNSTISLVMGGLTSVTMNANGGTLILSGANTFTGGMTIKSGTVQGQTNGNALGATTSSITIGDSTGSANATLYGATNGLSMPNPIIVASGNSGTMTLTGNGTFAGTITVNKDLTIKTTTNNLTITGGITGTGNVTLQQTAGDRKVTVSTGAVNMTGTITNIGSGPTSLTTMNTISSVIGTNVTGVIQNSASAWLSLSNTNTFTSGLTIKAGTVTGSSGGANVFGSSTSVITLGDTSGSANATIYADCYGTYPNPITVASGSSGTLTLQNGNCVTNNNFTGAITLNNNLTLLNTGGNKGLIVSGGITGTGNLFMQYNVSNNGGITLQTNPINFTGTITNNGTAAEFANQGNDGIYISAVIGTNITGVIQNAPTIMRLAGVNTFTTGITIKNGTVQAQTSNSALGTGTTTIGDTSGGNSASLIIGTNGLALANTIVLGAATGTLTIGNNLAGVSGTFSGGVTGTNNLTINENGTTGAVTFSTNAINISGTVTNIGAGSGTTTISGGIGSSVTSVIQNSITAGLTISSTIPAGCSIAADDANYIVCSYTASGSFVTPSGVTSASVLVVAGGGGGGSAGAGGGAGGYIASTTYTTSGTITVTVGGGGAGGTNNGNRGTNGSNSVFGTITATGGGGGGGYSGGSGPAAGASGGSGGGSDMDNGGAGGTGTSGQGNNGGTYQNASNFQSGGGGGAGAVGGNGSGTTGGNGGAGTANSISGATVTYAGGGGGGASGTAGTGGSGGGGGGGLFNVVGVNGTANRGGGGGGGGMGGGYFVGGNGGSGVVIVRYLAPSPNAITVNSGGTTLTNTAGTKLLTVSGNIAGTGNLIINNSSTTANGITLTGTINNTGTVTNSGAGSGTETISGALFGTNITGITQNSLTSALTINTASLTVNSAGTTLTNSAGTALLTVSAGVSGTGNLIINNNSSTASGVSITTTSINNTGTVTNSGTGSGAETIGVVIGTNVTGVVQNSSTSGLIVSAANTFTSGLTIRSGTVTGTVTNAFGANTSTITIGHTSGSADATLLVNATGLTFVNPIVLATGNSGTLTIGNSGTAISTTFTGGVTGTNNFTANENGTTGTITFSSSTINNSGTMTNVGAGSGTTTISGGVGSNVTGVIQNSTTAALAIPSPSGSGCTIASDNGSYTVCSYTASGSFITPSGVSTVSVLVIAGGGGGGGSGGGGGGGGGYIASTTYSVSGTITVTIGAGGGGSSSSGAKGTNGSNSVFGSLTATGGGGGGSGDGAVKAGAAGGSGGGASRDSNNAGGGNGTAGQGNNGGNTVASTWGAAAGGGGAGAVGGAGSASNGSGPDQSAGGNGGNGTANSITGTSVTYAGGGGGVAESNTPGNGGTGGGGAAGFNQSPGSNGTNGTANTGGGGGGGGRTKTGGTGGSGIVIVRYLTPAATGITVNSGGTTLTNSAGTALLLVTCDIVGTGNLIINNNSSTANGITITTGSINNTGTVTNSGTNSGTETIGIVIGSNVTGVIQNSATSQLTLTGTNTYTGTTTITSGILNANASAAIGSGGSGNTLVFNGGTLQAGGTITSGSSRGVTLTGNGTIDTNGNSVSIAGTVSGAGNFTKSGTGTLTFTGVTTVGGNFTISAGTIVAPASLSVAGNWTNSGTFTAGTGTTTLNGGNQTITGNTTFYNLIKSTSTTYTLTFAAGSTTTIPSGGSITLAGTSGHLLSLRSSSSPTRWNLVVNASATQAISYVDVMDSDASGGAAITQANSVDSGHNLNWNFSITISGTSNLSDGKTVKLVINGVLDAHTGTVSSGSWSISSVTRPTNGQIVTVWIQRTAPGMESTAVTKYSSGSVSGLVLNNGVFTIGSNQNTSLNLTDLSGYTLQDNEDVMHSVSSEVLGVTAYNNFLPNLTISILAGNTLTVGNTESVQTNKLNVAGTLTSVGNAAYTLDGSSGTIFTLSGTFTPANSTVAISGSGNTTINSDPITFKNLTIIGSGIKSASTSAAITFASGGTLNIASGSTFDPLTALIASGSNTLNATGTIRVASTTFAGSYPSGFSTIHLNTGSTVDYSLNGTQTVLGTLPYYNLSVSTGGTKTLGGNATTTHNITIGSGATFSLGSSVANVGGDWTNNGSFNAGTGEVILYGSATSTVTGATTFYDFTVTNGTAKEVDFSPSGIINVTRFFTIDGHSGSLIKLRSTSDGSRWHFHPTGVANVNYADVKDGGCESGAITMHPIASTNSLNNQSCWAFFTLKPFIYKLTGANVVEVYDVGYGETGHGSPSSPHLVTKINLPGDYVETQGSSIAVDPIFGKLYAVTNNSAGEIVKIDITDPNPANWAVSGTVDLGISADTDVIASEVYVDHAGTAIAIGTTASNGGIFFLDTSANTDQYAHGISSADDLTFTVHEFSGTYSSTPTSAYAFVYNYDQSKLYIYPYYSNSASLNTFEITSNTLSGFGKPKAISSYEANGGNKVLLFAGAPNTIYVFAINPSSPENVTLIPTGSVQIGPSPSGVTINDFVPKQVGGLDAAFVAAADGLYRISHFATTTPDVVKLYSIGPGLKSVTYDLNSGYIFGVSRENGTLYNLAP